MKFKFLTSLGTALAFVAFTAVSTQTAKADIITSLAGQSASGGMYNYTFSVLLTGDEEVNTSLPYAQFGTLYDLSTSSVSPTNVTGLLATDFTFASAPTNTNAYLTTVPDSATSWNLRYTFNGSPITGPQALGTFMVSLPTALPSMVFYDGEAGKSTGTPGNETGNAGSISISSPSSGVPEPASILLMGGGLLGIGFIGRRRFARKTNA